MQKDDPCVYYIRCKVNGKAYVGATMNGWKWRVNNHLSLLRRKKHNNRLLQADWDNFGEAGFEMGCVEKCSFDNLLKAEREAYSKLRALIPDGYNLVNPPSHWGMDTSGRFLRRKTSGNVLFARRVSPAVKGVLEGVILGKAGSMPVSEVPPKAVPDRDQITALLDDVARLEGENAKLQELNKRIARMGEEEKFNILLAKYDKLVKSCGKSEFDQT